MSDQRRARATYLLDTLEAAADGLRFWLSTGQYTCCDRCLQHVPAADPVGRPVRHQLGRLGQPQVWCEAVTCA